MASIWIQGKQQVQGEVTVQGCKNAVLPMMAAALLTDEEVVIQGYPEISDVKVMAGILEKLGCAVRRTKGILSIKNGLHAVSSIPEAEAGRLRASGILAGALVVTGRSVVLPQTGGCVIGERPMDLHMHAFRSLGYTVEEESSNIKLSGREHARSAKVRLAYPSVGATENAILASVLLPGVTEIHGAAREPEIEDLVQMMNQMGASIEGAGNECIYVNGVKKLHGVCYTVMSDRIAAGTYLMAAAASGGELSIRNICPDHLVMPMRVLRNMGFRIGTCGNTLHVRKTQEKIPGQIRTGPYPQYPTDLQAIMMPVMLAARGMSVVRETVFEDRFGTVPELCRMGADIQVEKNCAILYGSSLKGTVVYAPDLRGGAALAVAALTAEGMTKICKAEYISRGYEDIVRDFNRMGIRCRWDP